MKQIWYVQGDDTNSLRWPNFFESKEDAERMARHLFPDEDEYQRYARIYYRELFTAKDFGL